MTQITATNDFVIKFANVNGSGSASANELFAKAILRMGVPVSPRNIFPSNIQGLPTWYEVRVSGHGHLGRRGGVDFMVLLMFLLIVSRVYGPILALVSQLPNLLNLSTKTARIKAVMDEPEARGSASADVPGHDLSFQV